MSGNEVFEWKIFCITEGVWKTVWGPESPTTCPNNTSHDVNLSTISVVDKVNPDEAVVKQPTRGIYMEKSIKVDIPAPETPGDWVMGTVQPWYTDVLLWTSKFYADESMIGDEFDVYANPDNVIGVMTDGSSTGDLTIDVSSTVFSYASVGAAIELIDDSASPPVTEYFSEITDLDVENSQMTLCVPTTHDFPSGTKIRVFFYIGKDLLIEFSGMHHYGEKGFQAKLIPGGTVLAMRYKNNSGIARTFKWIVGYYYGL